MTNVDVWGWADEYDPFDDAPYYFAWNSPLMSTTVPGTATSLIYQMNHTEAVLNLESGPLNPGANRFALSVGRLGAAFSGNDFTGHRVYLHSWGARKKQIIATRSPNFLGSVAGDGEQGIVLFDTSGDDHSTWGIIESSAFDTRDKGFTSSLLELRFVPPQGDTYSFLVADATDSGHICVVDAGAKEIAYRVRYSDWETGSGRVGAYAFSNDGQWLAINCIGTTNAISIIERSTNTRVAHITSPLASQGGHPFFSFSDDSFYFYFTTGGPPVGTWLYRTSDWLPDVIVPQYTFANGQVVWLGLLDPQNEWMYGGYDSFFLDRSQDVVYGVFTGTAMSGPSGSGNSQPNPEPDNADWTRTGGYVLSEDRGSDVSGSFNSLRMSTLASVHGGGKNERPRWRPFQ